MEGHCSTGQSPQWAVVPMEEEEEEEEEEEKKKKKKSSNYEALYSSEFSLEFSSSLSAADLPAS